MTKEKTQHSCMLAKKFNDVKIKLPIYAQPKLDGIRGIFDPMKGTFKSRNGKPIEGAETLRREFTALTKGRTIVTFDGELILPNETFNKTSSVVRRKIANLHRDEKKVQYVIFDILIEGVTFINRLKGLEVIAKTLNFEYIPQIKILKTELLVHNADIERYHLDCVRHGYEGSMYRPVDGLYKFGYCKELIKRKDFKYMEVTVVAPVEGEGRLAGTLGALVVTNQDYITFTVGSGFTDAQRNKIWSSKKDMKGKILVIKYQELSEYDVPRFPTFKEFKHWEL